MHCRRTCIETALLVDPGAMEVIRSSLNRMKTRKMVQRRRLLGCRQHLPHQVGFTAVPCNQHCSVTCQKQHSMGDDDKISALLMGL